jgi:DNA-directed RNA polymerase subunit RPC12/RpoP
MLTHIDGAKIVGYVGILKDLELQECLRCGHEGHTHKEYELELQDEAEVVCPECDSPYYYLK